MRRRATRPMFERYGPGRRAHSRVKVWRRVAPLHSRPSQFGHSAGSYHTSQTTTCVGRSRSRASACRRATPSLWPHLRLQISAPRPPGAATPRRVRAPASHRLVAIARSVRARAPAIAWRASNAGPPRRGRDANPPLFVAASSKRRGRDANPPLVVDASTRIGCQVLNHVLQRPGRPRRRSAPHPHHPPQPTEARHDVAACSPCDDVAVL